MLRPTPCHEASVPTSPNEITERTCHGLRRSVHRLPHRSVRTARSQRPIYKRARTGEIRNFTGVSEPYEAPEKPELVLATDRETPVQSAERVVEYLEKNGFLRCD